MRQQWLWMPVLVGIGFLASAPCADAAFRLRVEDTVNNVGTVLTGTVVPAANPSGSIVFAGSVGSFTVVVTTGVTFHNSTLNYAELDLNSIVVTGTTAGTLRLSLEDTDYTRGQAGPLQELLGTLGGTLTAPKGSSITLQSWANGGNAVPNLGTDQGVGSLAGNPLGPIPGGSTAAFQAGGDVFGPGAFSDTGVAPFSSGPPPLYSLFSQVTLDFTGPGSASFDEDQQVVPVPGGLALALTAAPCLGVGYWLRRRRLQLA